MVEYSERLNYAMRQCNQTVTSLSKYLGVSYQAVKKVVDGKTQSLNAENSAHAARFLGVDHYWLATGEGQPQPNANDADVSTVDAAWPFSTVSPARWAALCTDQQVDIEARVLFEVELAERDRPANKKKTHRA